MQEAHSHRMFEYIRWNINWGYVISSSSRGSTKWRKNGIIIRIFSKSQNLNSPFEKIVIFQSQSDERWVTVFQHRDDSTILPSSPSGWNRVWLVSSLLCKCTSAKYTKCTTWHVAERWTGLGRDYFQRYFSLFFPVYIYISRRPRCFMEWRTLFLLRHFFPLERLIFQRRQVRCTKITGKNGGKIGGSCLETNTVNSVRSLWSNGTVKRMAIMAYSTSREFPLGRKEPRYPSWIINKFVFHQYYESWQIVYKYDKFFQIFIFPIFYERRVIVLVVYNTNNATRFPSSCKLIEKTIVLIPIILTKQII